MSQQHCSKGERQGNANRSTTPRTARRGLQYLVCASVCDALSGTAALYQMKSTEVQTLGELRIRDSLPLLGWTISMRYSWFPAISSWRVWLQ